MRLTELNPHWVGYGEEGVSDGKGNPIPERFQIGVGFDCPCGCPITCFIPFVNPIDGGPAIDLKCENWIRKGETFETLTLTPSIKRLYPNCWHGHIENGEVTFCSDSKKAPPRSGDIK